MAKHREQLGDGGHSDNPGLSDPHAAEHAEPEDAAGASPVADEAPGVAPAPDAASLLLPRVAVVELSGREDGRVIVVAGESAFIGRTGDALAIELGYDQWVSSRHAVLRFHDGGWWLEDIGSRNGTWLEATHERVREPVRLETGQVFRVGHTDLMLSDDPQVLQENLHYT